MELNGVKVFMHFHAFKIYDMVDLACNHQFRMDTFIESHPTGRNIVLQQREPRQFLFTSAMALFK